MNNMTRNRLLAILLPLLILLLLLPFTEYGHRILAEAAEPANREDSLHPLPSVETDPEPLSASEPEPDSSPVNPVPDFVGDYGLISISGAVSDIRDEDLALIRSLGIPLSLTIHEDGIACLEIFDEAKDLVWTETCLLDNGGAQQYPFQYTDGLLTVQEDDLLFIFKKTER